MIREYFKLNPAQKIEGKKLMAKKLMFIDPVCGMKIDPAEHDDSLHSLKYNEKDYYFCSPFCAATFSEDPEGYANDNYVIFDENENTESEN